MGMMKEGERKRIMGYDCSGELGFWGRRLKMVELRESTFLKILGCGV